MPKKSADGQSLPPTPVEETPWPRIVRELADDLATDAIARERAGKSPTDEVSRLREAGLLALLTPTRPAGRGSDWRTACAVVRETAAADSSMGELLARHYALAWSTRFFGSADTAERHEARIAEEHWLLGGSIDVPAGSPTDLTLAPTGTGYLLGGRRSFTAGVTVADRLILGATCTKTGDLLLVLVDPADPGVLVEAASERIGQRLAGAGSVDFDNVPVSSADHVLCALPRDEHTTSPFTALAPLALRLLLAHVALGLTEGALTEARDISRTAPPVPTATTMGGAYAERPSDDPYLLLAYGELAIGSHTAATVVEHATQALADAVALGPELSVDHHADVAVLVSAAEAVTGRTAVHTTTRLLELTADMDDLDGRTGLDRFWRNARVLTAQTPSSHRLRDIGDHFLNGARAPFTARA
ncbi:acyl-CoA dehydrogenase family protein [Streptomyces sp. NPDC056437]|uniref:acyl-CoA dehydrogenase family protein n=1 Tax=Streptomyces sp. NPDC056437 TaxID=3345816 RepID=UPI0036C8C456